MALKVFNTLSRQKEEFVPIYGKKVNMFVCGPTVYDDSHIGHGKTYTQFDIIVRYLRWKEYNVFYLMNITDLDDKVLVKANEESTGWNDIARKYEKEFLEDMKSLGNDSVDEYARATDHVDQIKKQIQELVEKGFAYDAEDGVYFDISKFPDYGKLSKQDLTQIRKGARVDVNQNKKDHADFVLWKKT